MVILSSFTVLYLDNKNIPFGREGHMDGEFETKYDSTFMGGGDGSWYNIRTISFEPGKYRITVDPIGDNITIILKSAYETVERNLSKTCSFEMDISSTLWQAVMVEDPPQVDFNSSENKVMTIHYEMIKERLESTTIILVGITVTGGVMFAANEARIYRRKRE